MLALTQLLTSRIALTQLVAIAFALLASIGAVLPAGLTQPGVLAAVLLISTSVTAVLRFGHEGDVTVGAKRWWQSKVIWTSIVGAVFAVLALFRIVPEFDQAGVVELVMVLVGVFATVAQPTATSRAIG